MPKDLMTEIIRLEGEIARIQRDLDALKRQAGVPSSRRTQTFPQMVAQGDDGPKEAVTREMPSVKPAPPQPSVAVASDVVPKQKSDRRVQASGRTGITDYPPSARTPSRPAGHKTPEPGAGRYEFVGEGSSRRRR